MTFYTLFLHAIGFYTSTWFIKKQISKIDELLLDVNSYLGRTKQAKGPLVCLLSTLRGWGIKRMFFKLKKNSWMKYFCIIFRCSFLKKNIWPNLAVRKGIWQVYGLFLIIFLYMSNHCFEIKPKFCFILNYMEYCW